MGPSERLPRGTPPETRSDDEGIQHGAPRKSRTRRSGLAGDTTELHCRKIYRSLVISADGKSSHLSKKQPEARPDRVFRLRLIRQPGFRSLGKLVAGQVTIPCSLGRSGITYRKREGDGATPAGIHQIIGIFVRADRTWLRSAGVPLRITRDIDGWCDDLTSERYNRHIRLPASVRSETMKRDDRLYDVVLVLDWNVRPRIKAFGSAIFMHLTREDRGPTAGCIALHPDDMRRLLPRLARRCRIVIR